VGRKIEKIINIYDISKFKSLILTANTQQQPSTCAVAYLLSPALKASKEELLSKMGNILALNTVQDVLNSTTSKPKRNLKGCIIFIF